MPYSDRNQQRTYVREWIAARRSAWFAANGPCVQCGSWLRLELDHVDPDRKVSHRIWSWSQERRDAELAKCQILCRVCHRAKTTSEWHAKWLDSGHALTGTSGRCGTVTGYRRGCRCVECCRAKSESAAKYRARVAS